jgi:hypothetical protein
MTTLFATGGPPPEWAYLVIGACAAALVLLTAGLVCLGRSRKRLGVALLAVGLLISIWALLPPVQEWILMLMMHR